MNEREILKMINKAKKKKQGNYTKRLVVFIILFVIVFAIGQSYVFIQVGSEQVVLVASVMSFATVQLWNMASIKKTKIKEHDEEEDEDGEDGTVS